MTLIFTFLKWLTGGPLNRVLSTVDKRIEAQTDKDRISGEIIKEHMATRAGWLAAGGIWTLIAWNALMLFHVGAVVVYSTFWCAACAYPKSWTIAALPAPLDTYEGWIILAGIGGLSLMQRFR